MAVRRDAAEVDTAWRLNSKIDRRIKDRA